MMRRSERAKNSTETAMVFGELYRNGAEWKFRAVGQGYASGLAGIARDYGVSV
jgi:tellurium resistance protein TerD